MARNRTVGYTPAAVTSRFRWIGWTAAGAVVIGVATGTFFVGRASVPIPGADVDPAAAVSIRDGIPVPGRRTAAGAATAAQNYLIAGFRVSGGTLDAGAASAVFLAPQTTATAKQTLAAPTNNPTDLGKTRSSFAALSAVVRGYDGERATVDVWGVSASSSQITPRPAGTEDWGSTSVTVGWDGAQWRVLDQHFTSGPWPARAKERMADADGDFAFRFGELRQQGWAHVAES